MGLLGLDIHPYRSCVPAATITIAVIPGSRYARPGMTEEIFSAT
jgi:hypothetical protein